MLEFCTALLFLTVAAGTAWAGLRSGAWQARGVHRLAPAAAPARQRASPAVLWRDLVNRIGAAVPASPKALPQLKHRLIRAGFRNPNAPSYFQGLRLVSALLFGTGGLLWAGTSGTPERVILGTAAMGMIGFIAPMQVLLMTIRRRQQAIARGLPNALDLMVVCVESGLGIDQTTLQVAKELQSAHPEICGEFTVMNLELRAGKRRAEALHNLADRTGVEDLKKLVAVLVQTDRFGTSIAQSLRGHAEYLRTMARQRAEERASKLAVKLVFPIFFCVLPSLFVVTIGPVMTKLVRDLMPMIENM
ncbi:MAG TPA: type II secretion system F family protein [Candidatus Sulfopaludibacter sp.]|jgi:tight adherence protein C|nr:type II secretion system F family protein [Candidatus Sulfopaludibacter sp.]